MKKIIILSLSVLSLSLYASKNASQSSPITANLFNSSTLSVGSIQQSLLTVSEFQSLNGNCWKLMDGTSLAGTDLGAIKGATMPSLPLLSKGEFLRQAKTQANIGALQSDAIRNIHGPTGVHLTGGAYNLPGGYPFYWGYSWGKRLFRTKWKHSKCRYWV